MNISNKDTNSNNSNSNFDTNTNNTNNINLNKTNIDNISNDSNPGTINENQKKNSNNIINEIKIMLKNMNAENVKNQLIKKGYAETEVETALQQIHKKAKSIKKRNANIVLFKDFFDKIGYGFASPLLMYLLLYTINAPLILFGIVAAAKSILTLFSSSIIQTYHQKFNVNKKFIAIFGTLFGFTFLIMAAAKRLESPIIFAIGILISSVFLVIQGDLYSDYVIKKLSKARSNIKSKLVAYFGLVITAIAFVSAGYILGFPNITINLGFIMFNVPGYLLELEIVAFAFILSSYAFSFVKPELSVMNKIIPENKKHFLKNYFQELKINIKNFLKNKEIKVIFYGALFSGAFQTVISTFSCIYIFETIKNTVSNPFCMLL